MDILAQHAAHPEQVRAPLDLKRELLRRLRRNAKHGVAFVAAREFRHADLYTTDLEVALAYLKWSEKAYVMLGPLMRNRQVMEASIVWDGNNVDHFDARLIDLPLWKKCLAHHHDLFENPPAGLDASLLTQQTLRECLPENGFLVEYLEHVDKAAGLIAVHAEPEALECLDPEMYEHDVDFAFAVVRDSYHGFLLNAFSFEIRANVGVMLAAVKANGSSLRYASFELRRNQEICFAAVREDDTALFSCDLTVGWADALVCAAIGKKWVHETRKIIAGIPYGADRAKTYAEGVLRTARGFELLCLGSRASVAPSSKRTRRALRLDDDCLRQVRKFLPKGKLYQEAERALEHLAADGLRAETEQGAMTGRKSLNF